MLVSKIFHQRVIKYFISATVAVIVFGAGFGIGNGSIKFHPSQAVDGNTALPDRLDYASVNQLYSSLKENYDGKLDTSQLMNGIKHGLVNAAGDPHTEYFTPAEVKQFNDQLNLKFSGIGAEIGKNSAGVLQIVAPLDDSPAKKAGIKAGDLVILIDGKDTSNLSVTEAVNRIRGESDTKVKLGLMRNGQPLNISVVRSEITAPSVSSKMLSGKVGYLRVVSFADDTTNLSRQAAESLVREGAKSIILDLRGNPGGELNAAVAVSSLWLDSGQTVVQEKRGTVVIDSFSATGGNILKSLPTVVLIDGGSASASEITASALKDGGKATLLGANSYGKGTVQQVIDLSDGSQLKVTVAKWYGPNDENIDKKGIAPDKVVKISAQDAAKGVDSQLIAAESLLSNKK
jgi:carboxyl-terminal processing protease